MQRCVFAPRPRWGASAIREAVRPLRLALVQTDLFARYAAFHALNRIGSTDAKAWGQIVEGFDSVKPEIREGALFADSRNV